MKEVKYDNIVIDGKLVLKLYISGMSRKSMEAIGNIKKLCDEYLMGCYELEIIDIFKNPNLAAEQQIVFSPSLQKKLPLPIKTLVGTLSDTKKVLKALGVIIEN